MKNLVTIQVMCGEKVLGVCEFGPETSESVLEGINSEPLDDVCKSICAVPYMRGYEMFFPPKKLEDGLE